MTPDRPIPDPGGTGKVNISPSDVAASAKVFYNAQTDLYNAWYALQTTLDDNSGMAGNDDLAHTFNDPYSKGTNAAWSALRASILTLGGISTGLTRSANNFVTAEHDSTAGTKGPPTLFAQEPVTEDLSMATTDSAIGSGDGVWFLPGPLSKFWPNADTGKLRNAAKGWHDAATAVDTLTQHAGSSLTGLETTDDSVASINAFWAQVYTPGDNTTVLAGTHQICQALGDACGKYADAVDSAHSQIKDALIGAGVLVGLTTAVGAVVSFFTGGGAAPVTAVADEAEVEGIAGPVIADAVTTVSTETAAAFGEDLVTVVEGAAADAPTVELEAADTVAIDDALDDGTLSSEAEATNAERNTTFLRQWAKDKGWVRKPGGGPETWGVEDDSGNFSWRLKIKQEGSMRPGLQPDSNVPRVSARLDTEGTYVNPFTGDTVSRAVGDHIPLDHPWQQ
jgi:hypothetical protein